MFFSIATPEYLHIQPQCSRVKAALTSGLLEIYEGHQDLIGSIQNGFIELDILNNNEATQNCYLLQDGIFVVSNEGLENESTNEQCTSIYIYARKLLEISKLISLDELNKELELKKKELNFEIEKLKSTVDNENDIEISSSKIIILKNDISFLEKAILLTKEKVK